MLLDKAERAYLVEMRHLTTDLHGREIFVGLTVEESEEYFALTRPGARDRRHGDTPAAHNERRERYLALHGKMELARLQTVGAEIALRLTNPTRN